MPNAQPHSRQRSGTDAAVGQVSSYSSGSGKIFPTSIALAVFNTPPTQVRDLVVCDTPVFGPFKSRIESDRQEPGCKIPGQINGIPGCHHHRTSAGLDLPVGPEQSPLKAWVRHGSSQRCRVKPSPIRDVVKKKTA